MIKPDVKFEARPADQLGHGWCVHVFLPSGQKDIVTGFLNQYQALNWIEHKSANWIVDKIMHDPA